MTPEAAIRIFMQLAIRDQGKLIFFRQGLNIGFRADGNCLVCKKQTIVLQVLDRTKRVGVEIQMVHLSSLNGSEDIEQVWDAFVSNAELQDAVTQSLKETPVGNITVLQIALVPSGLMRDLGEVLADVVIFLHELPVLKARVAVDRNFDLERALTELNVPDNLLEQVKKLIRGSKADGTSFSN